MDPRKRVRDRVWARQRIRALDLHVPAPKSGKHGAVHRCLAQCVVQTTRPCRLTDIDDLAFLHIVQDGFSVGIFDVRLHRRLVGGACAHEARLQLAKVWSSEVAYRGSHCSKVPTQMANVRPYC